MSARGAMSTHTSTSNNNNKRKAAPAEHERHTKKQKQIHADPTPKPAATNEIDDIFSKKSAKKTPTSTGPKPKANPAQKGTDRNAKPTPDKVKNSTQNKGASNNNTQESDDSFWKDSRGKMNAKRKYTEDGLPLYSEEELNIGKGGNTPLCPFDCTCCY